jgi:hypothetical protein
MVTVDPQTFRKIALYYLRAAMIFAVLLPAIVLVAAPSANAQSPIVNGCMQDVTLCSLGCTANDYKPLRPETLSKWTIEED